MSIVGNQEIVVNSLWTGQYNQNIVGAGDPSITKLSDGGWVVTWQEYNRNTGSDYEIYQTRFNSEGLNISSQIIVNIEKISTQYNPIVAALHNGGWVVTWISQYNAQSIQQQIYDASGNPSLQSDIVVQGPSSNGSPGGQTVTILSSGGWIVSWTQNVYENSVWHSDVYQRVYDESGVSQTVDPVLVNTTTDWDQGSQQVVALANGGWIVTWSSYRPVGNSLGYELLQKVYAADGSPVSSQDTAVRGFSSSNAVSDGSTTVLKNGDWVVTWSAFDLTGSEGDVFQKVYNSDGTAKSDTPTLINSIIVGVQNNPVVTALDNGGWVVTWQNYVNGSFQHDGIYQKLFASDGAALTSTDVRISQATDRQSIETVSLIGGGWIVIWRGNNAIHQVAFDKSGVRINNIDNIVNDLPLSGVRTMGAIALEDGGWVISWTGARDNNGTDAVFQRVFHLANDKPSGHNNTITLKEDSDFTFSANDFGYFDPNGDALKTVIIDSISGKGSLTLDGEFVTSGAEISVGDIGKLSFATNANEFGKQYSSLTFRLKDDGGTANGGTDTEVAAHQFIFDVVDVVDSFRGTLSNDKLIGTVGRDILDGKSGRDQLTGRGGSDVFVFKTNYDIDTITDFKAKGSDHDIIDIKKLRTIINYDDLMKHHISEHNGNVVIDGLHGDKIILKNIDISDLNASDFLF